MKEFKIGDRIKLIKDRDCAKAGMKGTVIATREYGDWGIKFDEKFDGGHNLCDKCENGYGQWIAPNEMKIILQFEAGQTYRINIDDGEKGNIIRIIRANDHSAEYRTIRGTHDNDKYFGLESLFARSLTLLAGSEIGEAIQKYDAEHSEIGVREAKRCAKVGDTIKIVRGDYGSAAAKIGAIGKVVKVDQKRASAKFPPYTEKYHAPYPIPHDNYVVLSAGKHSYTAEQIAEAKKLCGEMMVEAFDDGKTLSIKFFDKFNGGYVSDCGKNEVKVIRVSFGKGEEMVIAKCSYHDEYNVWIGRCVALCKVLHKPIPDFIMGD